MSVRGYSFLATYVVSRGHGSSIKTIVWWYQFITGVNAMSQYFLPAHTTGYFNFDVKIGNYASGTILKDTGLISMCGAGWCSANSYIPETNPWWNNTGVRNITVTGTGVADLSTEIQILGDGVCQENMPQTYRVTYCNNSPSSVTNADLALDYGAWLSYVTANPAPSMSFFIIWLIGDCCGPIFFSLLSNVKSLMSLL